MLLALLLLWPTAGASSPFKTITEETPKVEWSGTLRGTFRCSPVCSYEMDDPARFKLNVDWNQAWAQGDGLVIGVHWSYSSDVDIDLYVKNSQGEIITGSVGGDEDTESAFIENPKDGVYKVIVAPARIEGEANFRVVARVHRGTQGEGKALLLPDLQVGRPEHVKLEAFDSQCSISEIIEERARRCLRFDQMISNLGAGPFEIRYSWPEMMTRPRVFQRIYRRNGSIVNRYAGDFEFHPSHQHFHFKSFAISRLWRSDRQGHLLDDRPLRLGTKNGFCLIDMQNPWFGTDWMMARHYFSSECDPTKPATELVNGISVGWADRYHYYQSGQYIEVSGIEDGFYVLETIADPEDRVRESDETNNRRFVHIRICGTDAGLVPMRC